MEESPRKSERKRPYTRKAPLNRSFINTAEARREIVTALHLHRQSSKPVVPCSSSYNAQNYRRQLTESLPVPEPTWSTTAPAVRCAPVPTLDVLEVEWFDNVSSSSYSWWLGFLKSLDSKRDGVSVSTECGNVVGACLAGRDGEGSDSGGGDPNLFLDEWVVFPAVEEERHDY
ncbi:hypothetical protein ACS0TY_016213 [Phlomoides rotata]